METEENLNQIWKEIYNLIEIKENQKLSFELLIDETTLEKIDQKNKSLIITTKTKIDEIILNSDFHQNIKAAITKKLNNNYDLSIIFKEDYVKTINKKKPQKNSKNDSLNKKLNFDNFVVSRENNLLLKAAYEISLEETNYWNPFFIHGRSGLGKTHLLNAIGNTFQQNFPNKSIKYIEAKDFGNIVIKAFKTKNIDENLEKIKNEFENYDLLLIDDIEFIQNRKKTKEIFFNIFNFFIKNQKQVVVTSDQTPEELKDFEERFITRFKSGLLLNIIPPDIETAKKILKIKINEIPKLKNKTFSEDALDWIAINFGKNIRYLEGSLNKILLYSNIETDNQKYTLEKIIDIFQDTNNKKNLLTANNIILMVSQYYGISKNEILGKSRKREIVIARNICIYLIRELLQESLINIGKVFKKDHTTILNSLKNINNAFAKDKSIKNNILDLKQKLLTNY